MPATPDSAGKHDDLYEAAFDQSIVGMSILDPQGRVLEVNGAFCRIIGRSREEIVGRTSVHYTHPDDQSSSAATVASTLDPSSPGEVVEKRYVRPDGSVVWAKATLSVASRDERGEPARLIGIVEDITATRAAAEALQASEERLRQVMESVEDYAIFSLDLAGRITSWNLGAERLFGYASGEILGQDSVVLWPEPDRRRGIPQKEREEARRLGRGHEDGWRQRKDGSRFFANGVLTPIVTHSGEHIGFTKVCRDVTVQRETEAALSRARARLDASLMAGEVGTFVWEIPEDRLFGDANFAVFFNVTLGADGTAPVQAYIAATHPEDRPQVQAHLEETLRNGRDYEREFRIITGEVERWVIGRGKYERNAVGEPIRLAGLVLDITARKRAEEAQRASEGRYRFLSDLGEQIRPLEEPEAIMAVVTQGLGARLRASRCAYADVASDADHFTVRREYTSNGASTTGPGTLSGFGPQAVEELRAGKTLVLRDIERELAPGEGSETFLVSGVRAVVCYPLLRNGLLLATMAVQQAAPRDWTDDEIELVQAVAERSWPVIEHARSTAELRRQKRQLSFIIEAAQLGTFDWELPVAVGTIQWNDRLKGFFWLPPGDAEISPEVFDTKVHPDDRQSVRAALESALAGESRYDLDYRIVGPEGQIRWVHATGQTYEGGSGAARRFSGVVADVTAARLAAQERETLLESERAARTEAERTSRMKDEFLATLSHELRTPLNAILGWAQVLRSEPPPGPEDLEQGLSTIERNARAQTQIIEDLLDMSRIISGKVRLDVMRLDITAVLEQAIETVRPAAAARGIRLQPTLDRAGGPVSGDPNRLQQVFWNLLSNAIKFTPRHGRVQVLLERVNSHLEISIIDSGEGIRPEFLPHVFDRFRQQDASTTRRHGGLGLGLAIVRQLVELHGGTVVAHSAGAGQGATFRVMLPLVVIRPEDEEERRHPRADFAALASPDVNIRLDGVTVVVVDDEPDARELVKRLLEDRHASVLTAASATEALQLVQTRRPGVLVSDIGMPSEDGYSLIRRVRALNPAEGGLTPAVALTAYARSEDRMKAILAGFQMHVSKPVEAAELLTMVASLAGRT